MKQVTTPSQGNMEGQKSTQQSKNNYDLITLSEVHRNMAGTYNRVFREYTKLAIMASEALLRENKSSDKTLPPVGIEPAPLITSDSKSNTILSTLTWHVLLRRSLNFCSCTT